MPKSFSVANVIEKNKLATGEAFLVLLEIILVDTTTGGVVDTIYVVNNNENITYDLNIYQAFPFDLQLSQESGGVPEISLTATDFQKILISHMNSLSGGTGSSVIVRVVNSGNLSAEPELEETFEVIDASASDYKINVKLGAENALRKNFPRGVQMRDRCRWRYKGTECGYVGAIASCDLSLQGANGCAAHDNTLNFGGYPGLKGRGVRYG